MEMTDRYLEAVKFWLPKQQKDDIIDELSADIAAQIEEREAGLGRKLTETEVEAILTERGRPRRSRQSLSAPGAADRAALVPRLSFRSEDHLPLLSASLGIGVDRHDDF